jgi:hypothetical protein
VRWRAGSWRPAGPVRGRPDGLWRRWTLATAAGETAGFLVPAVAAVLLPSGAGDGIRAVVFVVAGGLEGAVLGWAQTRVLREAVPGVSSGAWVTRTALAAAAAWAIGLLPSLFWEGVSGLPPVATAVLAVAGGLVLLASIGVAQWSVLRRHLSGSAAWIGWTALGWSAGLLVFTLVTTPLWRPGESGAVIAAIGALGGALMACTVGAVTGLGLVRLVHRARAGAAVA